MATDKQTKFQISKISGNAFLRVHLKGAKNVNYFVEYKNNSN